MNPAPVIRRFRGCFVGGPLHGQDLPPSILPGGRLRVPVDANGAVDPTSEQAIDYLHRRLEDLETGEELELLVLESLDEAEAAALVDAERESRGGWGDPLVTLPATGFWFKPEAHMAGVDYANDGGMREELRLGVVTRFSRGGVCIAAHMADTSRPLDRKEADPTRCGWCEEGVGHTIEEHRTRVGATLEAERMLEIQPYSAGERIARMEVQALAVWITKSLYGPHPDEEAIALFNAEIREQVLQEAHAEFLRRRQSELVVVDASGQEVEQEAPATLDVGSGLVIAGGYRSRDR